MDIRTPTEYPGQREIADLLEDAQGSLWMASPSGLYRRWRDGSTARYTTRDGLPRDDVWDLFQTATDSPDGRFLSYAKRTLSPTPGGRRSVMGLEPGQITSPQREALCCQLTSGTPIAMLSSETARTIF